MKVPRTLQQPCDVTRQAGFSLVELLVVVMIMAVLISAIVACIAGGVKVWDAARTFDTVESETLLALRVLEKDVMRTFRFYQSSFQGESQRMAFPGLVALEQADAPAAAPGPHIGTIQYVFEPGAARLLRESRTFPEGSTRVEALLANVRALDFAYASPSATGASGVWQEHWDNATNFPACVRIELEVGTDARPLRLQRVFRLAVPPVEATGR